jgi:hypothetical protein
MSEVEYKAKPTRYPIYILSKGRAQYGPHTAKTLTNMGVDFYILIEPQEKEEYSKSPFIKQNQIVVLPFSNHGMGSGPARNYAIEHSKSNGFARHWLLDDNLQDMWRFHNNKRYRIEKGSGIFRAAEDFVDRFENVALSGFQYKFFCPDTMAYPPYVLNTRIMSCFLIDNSCPVQWRGKYNEDVDLSIRVLKEGLCTLLFHSFLCGKLRTGTVKGGNTSEIYNNYEEDASLKKSQMLKEMHPECIDLMERYGRTHHFVNLDAIINKQTGQSARQNALILKKDVSINNCTNNYGMKLMRNYGEPDVFEDIEFSAELYPKGRKSIHD